ncbi:molybdate ABC transporter substrate-binding protein [Hamadaea tsunoensis]|uniref:molybdate ABC transporter substrate-binding protein n=1 Tax=Hamadaea tsunoensis TaxID=53368 RepID=UPI0004186A31|nr:molybdate ABC transporter substrate-binding protein [Hamadaea tsunoensis]
MKRRVVATLLAVAAVALGACGAPGPERDNDGKINVYAAPSLDGVIHRLAGRFEKTHPGTHVVVTTAMPEDLTEQINAGAPADVLAATSPATMSAVQGLQPRLFGHNKLVIAVTPDNPLKINDLADLRTRKVALCSVPSPCGTAAADLLTKAGVTLAHPMMQASTTAAIQLLAVGDVDAAIVYKTDAIAAIGQTDSVEFPEAAATSNDVLVSTVPKAPNPAGAKSFLEFLSSAESQAIFTDAGFSAP